MADSQLLYEYEDFSKGLWFDEFPLYQRVPVGSFNGVNFVVHNTGMLVPRTGITTTHSTNMTTPYIATAAWQIDTANNGGYMAILTSGAFSMFSGTSITNSGVVWTTMNQDFGGISVGNNTSFSAGTNDGLYEITESTCTPALVSATVRGNILLLFKDRLVVTGRGDGRLYFSEPADYNNFPAANFIDIPPTGWRVSVAYVWNDTLILGVNSNLSDTPRWWRLTDWPKQGGALQSLTQAPQPLDMRMSALVRDGFFYQGFNGFYQATSPTTHERINTILAGDNLGVSGNPAPGIGSGQLAQSQDSVDMLITRIHPTSAENLFYHWNGNKKHWTAHASPTSEGWLAGNGKLLIPTDISPNTWYAVRGTQPVVSGGTYAIVARISIDDSNFPDGPLVDNTYGTTAAVTATASLPPYFAPYGADVKLRSVVVDFIEHTGSNQSTLNSYPMSLTALVTVVGRTGAPGSPYDVVDPINLNPSPTTTVAGNVVKRTIGNCPDHIPPGDGVSVTLISKHCSVRRVALYGTLSPNRMTR